MVRLGFPALGNIRVAYLEHTGTSPLEDDLQDTAPPWPFLHHSKILATESYYLSPCFTTTSRVMLTSPPWDTKHCCRAALNLLFQTNLNRICT